MYMSYTEVLVPKQLRAVGFHPVGPQLKLLEALVQAKTTQKTCRASSGDLRMHVRVFPLLHGPT